MIALCALITGSKAVKQMFGVRSTGINTVVKSI